MGLHNTRREKKRHNDTVLPIITILSLIYVIFYYAFGMVLGYTNNPYSTTLSGLIINFFSIWLIVCLKEYIRFFFVHVNIRKYQKLYYFMIFTLFFILDINILNIVRFNNILDLWAKELIIPIMFNLLMMYLSYITDYKGPIILRTILLLPSLLFSVVPNYEWFVIMIFNIVFCLTMYLILQYVIDRKEKDIPSRLIGSLHPRKWIASAIVLLLTIVFAAGFFSIKPVVILTGSMKPLINPGDMVIIKKCSISDIKVGDIVEYSMGDYSIAHRVISIYYNAGEASLITKGDANKATDKNPVTSVQLIGRLEYNIPYVGYPAYFLRNMVNNNKEVDIEQGG